MKWKVLLAMMAAGLVGAQVSMERIAGAPPDLSGRATRFLLVEGHAVGDGVSQRRMFRIDTFTGNALQQEVVQTSGGSTWYWARILEADDPVLVERVRQRASERGQKRVAELPDQKADLSRMIGETPLKLDKPTPADREEAPERPKKKR